ncbi:DUF3153 domain-containing protein [Actinomycetes bacterium KLBMP 9759]
MPSPTSHPAPSRRRSVPLVLLVLVALIGALTGCARVQVGLAIQPDDTVNGKIVLATPATSPDDPGPTVTLPPDLASEVTVTRYEEDGYTGSLLEFSGLTFEQVASLTGAAGPAGKGATLTLRRSGGRVLISGKADLTSVTVDNADFQLRITFPGALRETNGEADSDVVSWTFTPGEVGDIDALLTYDDPNAPDPVNWTLGLAGIVVLAALVVVFVAYRTRNPPVSPPIR